MRIDLGALTQLNGFVGAAVVDSETGLILGRTPVDLSRLEAAAAANMDVLRAARAMVQVLDLEDDVEDTHVSLGGQFHLVRTISKNPAIFLYLLLDRRTANLGIARLALKQVEEAIVL